MDKKQMLTTLSILLGAIPPASAQASSNVDLRSLEIMKEEGISYEEFQAKMNASAIGTYSNHSISDGNYSRHSISDATYSRHSISDGNYSRHSISDATYSRHSISGRLIDARGVESMPAPVDKTGSSDIGER